MEIYLQLLWLFILAIPVASISWTVTKEEIFIEFRKYCGKRCEEEKALFRRKFFYLFTCEYCFSHYITLVILYFTKFHLLYNDWRGYFIAGFSIVWIANVFMSFYALLRQSIKKEKTEIKVLEKEADK